MTPPEPLPPLRAHFRRYRRFYIGAGTFFGLYGLLLIALWGARMLQERAVGQITLDEIQRRSTPICRLFNGLPDASQWRITYYTGSNKSGAPRNECDVDCSYGGDTHDPQSRPSGALIRWDADTGALLYISNNGVNAPQSFSPTKATLTPSQVVTAARSWLSRLQLDITADPWVFVSTSGNGVSSLVRWRRKGDICAIKIDGRSGELIQLWLSTSQQTRR